jgi:hypothetical protein
MPIRPLVPQARFSGAHAPAAGWRRALDKARGGEAEGKGRSQEERRLATRELRRGGHQLLEVLFAQHVRELLDLTCCCVDVFGYRRLILLAHLAACVVQGRRHSIEGAGHALLLRAELRRRLLASRIDELHGLVLRLANDLGPLTAQTGATAHAGAAAGPL